jgi:ferredoxin
MDKKSIKGASCMEFEITIVSDTDIYVEHTSTRYIGRNTNLKVPVLYNSKYECCGCSACYSVCDLSGNRRDMDKAPSKPVKVLESILEHKSVVVNTTGAITMLPDEEGFLYPVVDTDICVGCMRCMKVCPMK